MIQNQEMAELVGVIIQSFKETPNQFQLTMNVGAMGLGGINPGIVGVANHNSGGTNIGFQAHASSSSQSQSQNITITNAVSILQEIQNELHNQKPDVTFLKRCLEKLKSETFPKVIVGIIAHLISKMVNLEN